MHGIGRRFYPPILPPGRNATRGRVDGLPIDEHRLSMLFLRSETVTVDRHGADNRPAHSQLVTLFRIDGQRYGDRPTLGPGDRRDPRRVRPREPIAAFLLLRVPAGA